MQDYELKFNKNERRINEVHHREYGPIEFEDLKMDKTSQYVFGSRVVVYTTLL